MLFFAQSAKIECIYGMQYIHN